MHEFFHADVWALTPRGVVSLVRALMRDPRSRVHAAEARWDHPVSREWLLLADLWDLEFQKGARKGTFKPYPRPFGKQKLGGLRKRTAVEALRILRPNR